MNPLHARLAEVVNATLEEPWEMPAFKRWFGESPLVSEAGRPMVLYHGSTADISAFDLAASGSDGMLYSLPGIFATDDSELASDYAQSKLSREIGGAMRELQRYKNLNSGEYGADYEDRYQALRREFSAARLSGEAEHGGGANVIPVYVSLQNPLVVDAGGKHFAEVIPDAVRLLVAGGHDGLIVNNVIDAASEALKRPAKIVMALDPGQLKSAIGNDGSYDLNNPDIRYSLAAVGDFDKWFEGSKVTRRGRPMVVYHRTASVFDEFDTDRGDLGTHFGTAEQAKNLLGGNMRDGENTIPVYLSIKHPLRLIDKGGFHADAVAPQLKRAGLIDVATAKRLALVGRDGRMAERRDANREIKAILAAAGYDGIVYKNSTEGSGDSYIAFNSWQIASAINNGPGASNMQLKVSTPDSVREAISHLVRVSADDLVEGVGGIVVATSDQINAGAFGSALHMSLQAPAALKSSNAAASTAFEKMVNLHRGALESVLFNWSDSTLGRDDDSIVWAPSADPHRPQVAGRGPSKKAFLMWLMSDGPFDEAQYGADIGSDSEWCGAVEALRSVVLDYELAQGRETSMGHVEQSPVFQAWFGDSKVVDADGKPLKVYHGTASEFNVFKEGRGGFYFTDDRKAAQAYAENIQSESESAKPRLVDVYLSIKNPLVLGKLWYEENVLDEDGDQDWETVDNMIYEAEESGHDGLILRGFPDFDGMDFALGVKFGRRMQREYDQYIAFHPEQIKSATGNRGAYDPNDPDIRHSLAAGAAGLDSRAQAFHDVATNTTVFLADRIPAGREASVFLHEIVHRHGRQALPEGHWGALVGQVKAWAQAEPQSPEKAIHDAAAARVATAGVAGALADEELFAYAVEEAVARGIEPTAAAVQGTAEAWLQAVVESIQRVSDKLIGNGLQDLGGQDLVDLAYALAQLDSPEHGAEVRRAIDERLESARPMMATAEQSRAYAEAVAVGHRRKALRVLHAAAGIQSEDYSFDRGGAHGSPDPVHGAPMWDVSRGIYPEDLYQGRMHEYGTHSPLDPDAFEAIRHADGRPNAFVTVYRSVEKSGPSKIQPGDWVTPSRKYAKEHGQDNISGAFKIISKMVCARDLYTDGNSILEWGYHPQEFLPEFPRSEVAKSRTLQERLDASAGISVAIEGPVTETRCVGVEVLSVGEP